MTLSESLLMLTFIALILTLCSHNLPKQQKKVDTFCVETISGRRGRTLGTAIRNLYKGALSKK